MEEKIKELIAELNKAFTYIGGRLKAMYAAIGDLSTLKTTKKDNLVAALNELQQTIATIQATGGGVSSQEVQQKIEAAITAFKQDLYGGQLTEESLRTLLPITKALVIHYWQNSMNLHKSRPQLRLRLKPILSQL